MHHKLMPSISIPHPGGRRFAFAALISVHVFTLCACAPVVPSPVRLGTPTLEPRPDCTVSRAAPPRVPREAVRAGVEGWTLVSFDITSDGAPSNVRIADSRPGGVFDQASLEAVRGWRFAAGSARINCQTTFTFASD